VHVQWAIPCRYVEVQQTGAVIVGAGTDLAVFPNLPTPAQMNFAVRYVGLADELDGETEHPIACRIFDPQNELLGEQRATLKASAIMRVPGYVAELIVPTTLVLEVKQYGTYRVEFSIDDCQPVNVPLHCLAEIPPPE
jgi:hypothetical protein